MEMFDSPEFWTPQELTEKELGEICKWLGAWQAACVTADSLDEEGVVAPSRQLDPNFRVAKCYVQDLIRHIGAMRAKKNEG